MNHNFGPRGLYYSAVFGRLGPCLIFALDLSGYKSHTFAELLKRFLLPGFRSRFRCSRFQSSTCWAPWSLRHDLAGRLAVCALFRLRREFRLRRVSPGFKSHLRWLHIKLLLPGLRWRFRWARVTNCAFAEM